MAGEVPSAPDPGEGAALSGLAGEREKLGSSVSALMDTPEPAVSVGEDPMDDLSVLPCNVSNDEFLLDSGWEMRKEWDLSSSLSAMLTGTVMTDVFLLPGKATMEEFLVSRRYAKEEACEGSMVSDPDTMEEARVSTEKESMLLVGVFEDGETPELPGTAMAEEARAVPTTDPPVAPGAPPPPARLCDVAGVPCPSCRRYVRARRLRYHRELHGAYTRLGFDAREETGDLSAVSDRRWNLVAEQLSRKTWSRDALWRIDAAYDLLRAYLRSRWPFLTRRERLAPHCEHDWPLPSPQPGSCPFLTRGLCQDRNAAWRTELEDSSAFLPSYGGRSDAWFVGLFGGNHGASAARLSSVELPPLVLEQLVTVDSSFEFPPEQRDMVSGFRVLFSSDQRPGPQDPEPGPPSGEDETSRRYYSIHQAMARAFLRMDRILALGRHEKSKVRWSGCSVAICLIEAVNPEWSDEEVGGLRASADLPRETGTVHLANAGDVQIVLCKNGKGYRLTEKHDTSNSNERKRILQTGGQISKNKKYGLVDGRIQTTRGLGYLGDEMLKKCIIPFPYTASVPIDPSCQFLILASGGFWKVLSIQQVISISLQVLSFYSGSFEAASQEIYISLSVDSILNRYLENDVDPSTKEDLLQQLSINEEEFESVERLLEELSTYDQYSDLDLSVESILHELMEKKDENDDRPIMERLIGFLQDIEKSRTTSRISTDESIYLLSPNQEQNHFITSKEISPIQEQSEISVPEKHSTLGVLNTKEHNNRTSVEDFDKELSTKLEGNDNRSAEAASTVEAPANEENDKNTSVDQSTKELSPSKDKHPSVSYSKLLPGKEEDKIDENRLPMNAAIEEQDNLISVEHFSRLSSREEGKDTGTPMKHSTEEVLPSEKHADNKASVRHSATELSPREQPNDTKILKKHSIQEEHSDGGTSIKQSTEELSPDKEPSNIMMFTDQEFVELSPNEESIHNDSGEDITKESNNLQESVLLASETPSAEKSDVEQLNEEPRTVTGWENMNLKGKPTPKITKQKWYEIMANLISKRLVQAAKEAGSHENISVLMLLFPGCEKAYFTEATMEDRDVQD
ncbi:uncharacterized protein LOC103181275 [Callorhinchus milii]|uniref:uncharacterized protein LOC103181275 n=1 Tax=Callorhinchus milii TaxID=7868 RepID=UPI0004574EDF|nr:uncharacterized protein LOC103181275 [Callorhinchus milii]|eukprot:gi/632959795/ref/XP_007895826.1/ PREDICTED: protein phosphatase 2C-like domain-containing protein 1 [Callorhinchus milii]